MFKVLLVCAVVGIAVASPLLQSHRTSRPAPHSVPNPLPHPVASHASGDDLHAEIVERSDDVRADGFKTTWDLTNHISERREGDEHGNIHGDFEWISPEGEKIGITYVADENGYQPHGDHLPTPPPIPVEIQRALEWIAAHPPAPEHSGHH